MTTINKQIKNKIDNLNVGDRVGNFFIDDIDNIEGLYFIYRDGDKPSEGIWKDYGEVFDILYGEYVDNEQDKGVAISKGE